MASSEPFRLGQRVHSVGDPRRIGTVKYVGTVEGYSGIWVGVDWDTGEGKHDGTVKGTRYFQAKSENSGSLARPHNLSSGISFLEALCIRYKGQATKEEEDGMYVLSTTNRRVSVEFVGKEKIQDKLSRFEELTNASLSFLGVNSPGSSAEIGSNLPNLKELDLTGNLLSEWKDIGTICEQLPSLKALNLSHNLMADVVTGLPRLSSIRVLVLNCTGVKWTQVEELEHLLPVIEELHLMGNGISEIKVATSSSVQRFESLRLLNLEDNCIAEWGEIIKISMLRSLEHLQLNKNNLKSVFYPDDSTVQKMFNGSESREKCCIPFENLRCLLLASNNIGDLASIDALNLFPNLMDIRISENPITEPTRGGIPRYVLVARLSKVELLNGSEIRARDRKECEIRYVRLVMSQLHGKPDEIKKLHPRFTELKLLHGIEDERPSIESSGPQKMATGLLSITLKCVGASMGEKAPMTKKLPASTTVGKLKILCGSFFKLKSVKLKLFLEEEGCPLPLLLDDEMASLVDVGAGNGSTILVDEES
ncbi:Tubulin-folding cofactor E [Linum perenne]